MDFYRPIWGDQSFDRLFDQICSDIIVAPGVNTGHWQAKKDVPMTETQEIQNAVLELPIAGSPGAWASWMKPNLPWAEDHFLERVSGKPLNPPPSHEYWPFNQQGNVEHMDGAKFSHSYPERLWPRFAGHGWNPELDRWRVEEVTELSGMPEGLSPNYGIRYEYGDLQHAVDLLVQEPHTRQCFIPLWFPEDLYAAAVEKQRVPCTLGYHAMMRNRKLNLFYPMRSLDLLRYARDDFYMAGRLVHWLIEKCREQSGENSPWQEVNPGLLNVHAVSLHIFKGDVVGIRKRLEKQWKVAA